MRLTAASLPAYHYLWLKDVIGFDPRRHCAAGLLGGYRREVRAGLTALAVAIPAPPGSVLYLCGVSRYALNLHAPLRVRDGATAHIQIPGTAAEIEILGAELLRVPGIGDVQGAELWPKAWRTCRNWLWGVQHFRNGRAPACPGPAPDRHPLSI